MDKKVLKAIYANVVSRDELRPVMCGIYFEEKRCVGCEGYILVVYNSGSKKLAGKIIRQNGETIEGNYPNYERIIPKDRVEYERRIDLKELYAACSYHLRKSDSMELDDVSILHKTFRIKTIVRLLTVFAAAGELNTAVMYKSDPKSITVIESNQITAVMQPTFPHGEEFIDQPRLDETSIVLSYENLMNDYALNSWRRPESKDEMSWIK